MRFNLIVLLASLGAGCTRAPQSLSETKSQIVLGSQIQAHEPIAEASVEKVGGLLSPFYRGQLRWSLAMNVAFTQIPESLNEALPQALKFEVSPDPSRSPIRPAGSVEEIWGFFEVPTRGKLEDGKRYAIGTTFTVDVIPSLELENWKASLRTALVCQKQVSEGKFEDTFVTGEQRVNLEFPAAKTIIPSEPSLQNPNPAPLTKIELPKEQRVTIANPPRSGIVTFAECPDRIKIQIWAKDTPHFTLRALEYSIFEVTGEF